MKVLSMSYNEKFLNLINTILIEEKVDVLNIDMSKWRTQKLVHALQLNGITHCLMEANLPNLNYALLVSKMVKEKNPDIQIIMFMDFSHTSRDAIKALANGVTYTLQKPFFPQHLLDLITSKKEKSLVSV